VSQGQGPYRVEFSLEAQAVTASLPPEGRSVLADAVAQLAADPWQGERYRPGYPPEYRMLAFGGWGTVMYVIGERTAAVLILDLLWAG
jgi:hypothetical protein